MALFVDEAPEAQASLKIGQKGRARREGVNACGP